MLIDFVVPVSPNWYAVGIVIFAKDFHPFDENTPIYSFVLKEKALKDKVTVRLIESKKNFQETKDFIDQDDCVLFGMVNRKLCVPCSPSNWDRNVLEDVCDMIYMSAGLALSILKTQKKREFVCDIPKKFETDEVMQEFESVLSMISQGYTIEEQNKMLEQFSSTSSN